MSNINIRLDHKVGTIKPLHGVNNGPKTALFTIDTSEHYRRAGIPLVRLHDTEYPFGAGHFVDIHCVFPNFDADPFDPASYSFEPTDDYIAAIRLTGANVVYRLGESIEHFRKKFHIFPPHDNLKWAQICEGIIRHYNEGWANGFTFGIEFWEIWNEPDNEVSAENSPMWQGTERQYFDLYCTAANYLKDRFPHLKIGGYASCGFYATTRDTLDEMVTFVESPSRIAGFVAFFHDFLKHITAEETRAPLDFFSWHLYTSDPDEMAAHARYASETLRRYGLPDTLTMVNEWNYAGPDMFHAMKTNVGAAFVGGVFCALQRAPVDMAVYYDGQPKLEYCGLFEKMSNIPTPTYYAFDAFGELYRLGTEVESHTDAPGTYVLAAADGEDARVLLVNRSGKSLRLSVGLSGRQACACEGMLIDDTHTFDPFSADAHEPELDLQSDGVALLRIKLKQQ